MNCWIIHSHTDSQQPTVSTRFSRLTPETTSSTGTAGEPASKTSYTSNFQLAIQSVSGAQARPLLTQPQFNLQNPPPYPGQWQQQAPSIQPSSSDSNNNLSHILNEQQEYFKFMQEKKKCTKNAKMERGERQEMERRQQQQGPHKQGI